MTRRIICGIHAVTHALQESQGCTGLWLEAGRQNQRLNALEQLAQQAGIPVRFAPREVLDRMASHAHHQGAVVEAEETSRRPTPHFEDWLDQPKGEPLLLLVLDGVQDPHNLGACMRTAEGAGAHCIVVPKDRAVGLTPTVEKVAAGAAQRVPFFAVTNLSRTLRLLHDRGVWIVGTSDRASETIYEADFTGDVACVMGSEASGMRRMTAELCDFLVKIPMHGAVSSLNVAVAAGVVLYEARRQRRPKSP